MNLGKAQSNLTLLIHDEVKKGYFKQESFEWTVRGLKNYNEANTFINSIKKDNNIKTANILPIGQSGEYKIKLSVYKIYGKRYFSRLFLKNGVSQAIVNGKTEILKENGN